MATRPVAPGSMTLDAALGGSAPLQTLLQRLKDSEARFESLRQLLPAELQAQLRPGPLDEAEWSLLAEHSAAAAKARQLLPRMASHLQAAGWPLVEIKLKVRPRG